MSKIEDTVVELRIGQARQDEQIKTICDKIDVIDTNVKDIHKNMVSQVKSQNSQLKTWLYRSLIVMLGSGATAGGIQGIMSIFGGK